MARRRGLTMMEVLIVSLLSLILGTALVMLTKASYDAQYSILNQNKAITDARDAIDNLADRMRGMQINSAASPVSCFSAATATDVTFYDYGNQYSAGGATTLVPVRYWFTAADKTLRRTVNSLPNGGLVVARNLTGVAFSYSVKPSTITATPTSGQLASIYAVTITATMNVNGYAKYQTSYVQVRQQH
jgi:Tfp pilus assembly protein PilV